jgi:UDP-N-acetylmuramate--alanine ligase
LRDLFEDFCTCFNDADAVLVADVYPAGENLIKGINRETLVEGVRSRGHRQVLVVERPEDLAAMIDDLASQGDYVVCLGAGSITAWANALPGELMRLRAAKATIRRGAEG